MTKYDELESRITRLEMTHGADLGQYTRADELPVNTVFFQVGSDEPLLRAPDMVLTTKVKPPLPPGFGSLYGSYGSIYVELTPSNVRVANVLYWGDGRRA